MIEVICDFLTARGVHQGTAALLARSSLTVLALVLSIVANFLAKHFILKGLTYVILRTETTLDDILLERKVFNKLSHLAPAVVLYVMLPLALEGYDRLIAFTVNSIFIYMIIIGVLVIDSFLNALLDIYRTLAISKEVPIKSFIQIVKVAIYCIVGIFIISIVIFLMIF